MEGSRYLPVDDQRLPNIRIQNWASVFEAYCRNYYESGKILNKQR